MKNLRRNIDVAVLLTTQTNKEQQCFEAICLWLAHQSEPETPFTDRLTVAFENSQMKAVKQRQLGIVLLQGKTMI
ncbi:hypothetical protein SAMN02745165_00431 [Malonomonas rubra DSM 5091]|uniref:Uncharacterized protein n=1 Tax=Malonomonas rubra DSM 5091 TaxID=1122189 RepID=A0A1M6C7A8_MALRU|nr:hypothetical protein SAMN02745165_00431 [Malonomonas rubra DSM 5091]